LKKDALEAVIGVLGVLGISVRGGGVDGFCCLLVLLFRASIFAAMGVLSGNKFSGGSFKGCKFFLPRAATCFPLTSGVLDPIIQGAGGAKGSVVLLTVVDGRLESEPRADSTSKGRLDLRALVGNTSSDSVFGDSYALGIAGTGGTSSFPLFEDSIRGFGVGSREEENV
jgi:hypothetical protein